ncbi:unnamed protein product [Trichobilharzia regenti]|nr:unnamed protein product [Trichobilharzia regenti]
MDTIIICLIPHNNKADNNFQLEIGNHFLHFTMTIWDVVRLTNILLLSRAARLMNLFKWSRLVVSVLADLPRNLSPVLGILMSAFYFYALLGMNLFYNVIKYDNSTNISKA